MAKGNKFRSVAPKYMKTFMSDFDCTLEDAAAAFGNFGHESMGFEKLQEMKPTVEGSRGGFGWPQFTGPRRRAYEAYCKRNNLDPTSDEANYKYIFVELKGPERAAIPALKNAGRGIDDPNDRLMAKVKAFELNYERAGVKHYPSRLAWAKTALAAYHDAEKAGEIPEPKPMPKAPEVAENQPVARRSAFWDILNKVIGRG